MVRVAQQIPRPVEQPVRFWPLLLCAYVGTLSHPALDWLNSYGIRLLMPFSERWFYGDALYIVDPIMYVVLGAGWWLAWRREKAVIRDHREHVELIEDQFELTARRVRVRANQGTVWSGVPPGTGSTPYVDFMQSFPDTDGFAVRTGSTEDESEPLTLDFEDALIGVSADRMLLQISDAVLITGGFSLLLGPVEYVDVVTGLNGTPAPGPVLNWLNSILLSTAADADGDGRADDPGDDLLRRSADYGIIYNLPVRTMQLGITDASVFLGWAAGLSAFSLTSTHPSLEQRLDTLDERLLLSGRQLLRACLRQVDRHLLALPECDRAELLHDV